LDFAWNAEQVELHRRALAFAKTLGASDEFSQERWSRCGDFGLLGLCVPKELGGTGLDALMTARVLEAFGKGCPDAGLLFSASAHLFACVMPIIEHANPALSRAIVPQLAAGRRIGANAITEAESGSDVFAMKTSAVRDGDHYVLQGTKSYVTNGPVADVFVVYAVTHPGRGFFGLTGFVVELGAPGLVRGKPFEKVGLHSAQTGALYFDQCRVPVTHRLGDEGQGAPIFQASMDWERACLFASYVGGMDRDLETAISFARERQQFGRPIGKNQAVSHRIADMKLRLEAARLLLYRACWAKDRGASSGIDISLAKLAISEGAVQSGLDLVQLHGSLGVSRESGLARSLLDALPSTIFSGTSEIQRDLVARALGL
jgi:alkylation response protein AidB-like acyl-CoA dehydrogenase